MAEQSIICPNCRKEIPLTKALPEHIEAKDGSKHGVGGAVRLAPFVKLVESLEKERESLLDKIRATSPDNAAAVKRIREINSKLISIQDAFTNDLVQRVGGEA